VVDDFNNVAQGQSIEVDFIVAERRVCMLRFIIMLILLIGGLGSLLEAKLLFAKRQVTEPDNKWSAREQLWRRIGYSLCAIDFIIAGFINF